MTDAPVAYFTIVATNFLPKALTLAESLGRHEDATLKVVLIDVPTDAELPTVAGVELLSTAFLELDEQELHRLATIYTLVEFATAIKPRIFSRLLAQHEAAYYLDPDLYLTAPMAELPAALAATEGGILLTPAFLAPPPPDAAFTEGHLLNVGIYNLGFCGVDRRAVAFVDWWWDKLRFQCLFEPLSGLFVDQKWVDVGAVLFRAGALRHHGYNTGVSNLHERPIVRDGDAYVIETTGEPLRLFHFHAFDSSRPDELSTRFAWSTAGMREVGSAIDTLCHEYAAILAPHEAAMPAPAYRYADDTEGKPIPRQIRRAYRIEWSDDNRLPSPFDPAQAKAWAKWRRKAWKRITKTLVGDAAKTGRAVLPDEADWVMAKFPRLRERLRSGYVDRSGLWK